MTDPKRKAEGLYLTAWSKPKLEHLALATDVAKGCVRPEFARWVRNGRKGAAP